MNPGIHRGLFRERFMISTRISPIALAVSSAIILSACGGGGGSSSSGTAAPASVSVTVTPSLGKFSSACTVEIRKGSGELLGTQLTDAEGSATIVITGYSGPIIAQVKGSDSCSYYDEARDTNPKFGIGQVLSAVVDSVRTTLGVNVLTNLAAARVLDGDKLATGKTETEIRRENATVQQMFQVGNMFAKPTLISKATDRIDNTEAGKLAAKLAALAELARTLNQQITEFSAALASDLKDDGDLNTLAINAAALKTALQAAVDNYAADDAKLALNTLDDDTTLKTKVTDVQADVGKILAAGTALDQAKQIFADLRTSIMSISNDAGTGSLDVQNAQLKDDLANGADVTTFIENLSLITEASANFFAGSDTYVANEVGQCDKTGATTALCYLDSPDTEKSYEIFLNLGTNGVVTWTTPRMYDYRTQQISSLSGLTGTLSRSGSTTTLAGNFYPMTGDAAKTNVNLNMTYSGSKGQQLWSGNGTLNALKADGTTSTLKFEATEVAISEANKTAKFVATLTGPHHRFDGTLEVSGETLSKDGQSSPKNGKFVGTFTNTATGFKFLEGTLTGAIDQSNFDYTVEKSATNYDTFAFSFKGTAYKSSNVLGVGLDLTASSSSYAQRSANFTFTGSNNLTITGTGTQTRTVDGERPSTWTLANSNGITATYDSVSKSGKVLKADGSTLGTISSQRVTFIDGTFESLL